MARILIVAPNWIGDALMAQPLLSRLRAKQPNVRLEVLAPKWVAPVLRRMPEVNEVIETPFRHGALQLYARWQFGRSLRERGYQHAIVLPNSWKSALVPYFANIKLRGGYVGEARYGLLNLLYRTKRRTRTPMAQHYARLAHAPGTDAREALEAPKLLCDRAAAAATAGRFSFLPAPGANVVLCPGAEYGPAKRWPVQHFGALAAALGARGVRVWLIGSQGDAQVCDEVVQASRGAATSLAGKTTLDEAIELIAYASATVSNDSGLMHIAAALGRPQVALYGSSSPEHTPPRSERARIVWLGIECSPCFARECPLGHFRCMRELSVERVLEEIGHLGVLPSGVANGGEQLPSRPRSG
jgi:heptosyltransferase II